MQNPDTQPSSARNPESDTAALDFEPSTSSGTLRGVPLNIALIATSPPISEPRSASSSRTLPRSPSRPRPTPINTSPLPLPATPDTRPHYDRDRTCSATSSPVSSLPSPPDSPGSSSSFPSLSSSFFQTSGVGASPQSHPSDPSDHEHRHHHHHEHDVGLIIPSLTLPPLLRRETPYGAALGQIKVLVVNVREGNADGAAEVDQLVRGLVGRGTNEHVVESTDWEEFYLSDDGEVDGMRARVMYASTTWADPAPQSGFEPPQQEGARNVTVLAVDIDPRETEMDRAADRLLHLITSPFSRISSALAPPLAPSQLLLDILSGPSLGLWTLGILLHRPAGPPSTSLRDLAATLATHLPLVPLPTLSSPVPRLSALRRAADPAALQTALFRSPRALRALRAEAGERVMWWREIRRAVATILPDERARTYGAEPGGFDAERWAREWETGLSRDLALALRRRARNSVATSSTTSSPTATVLSVQRRRLNRSGTVTNVTAYPDDERRGREREKEPVERSCSPYPQMHALDPLHVPSLLASSAAVLDALRQRVFAVFARGRVLFVLVAFVAGVGIGTKVQERVGMGRWSA